MRYTTVWQWAWTFVAAAGVGLAMLEWSAAIVLIVVLVLTAVIAALLSMLAGELVILRGPDGSPSHVLAWAAAVASAGTGLLALVTVSPPVALLVLLLLVLTSPPLVRRLTGHLPGGPTRRRDPGPRTLAPPATKDPEEAAPVVRRPEPLKVASLSDKELFYLWRRTFWELRGTSCVDDRLAVISLRQACLEELEKRDPEGLTAWLDSGGRASGGPERFWHTPPQRKEDDAD